MGGGVTGARRGGGETLVLFPQSSLLTNKAACVVPAVLVNSDQGHRALFSQVGSNQYGSE